MEQGAYRVLIRDVTRLYGKLEALEFGSDSLKAVRQVWVDEGQKRRTVNEKVSKLCLLSSWAAAEELIPTSIPERRSMVAGLRKGRIEAPESLPVRPVSIDVVSATMDP